MNRNLYEDLEVCSQGSLHIDDELEDTDNLLLSSDGEEDHPLNSTTSTTGRKSKNKGQKDQGRQEQGGRERERPLSLKEKLALARKRLKEVKEAENNPNQDKTTVEEEVVNSKDASNDTGISTSRKEVNISTRRSEGRREIAFTTDDEEEENEEQEDDEDEERDLNEEEKKNFQENNYESLTSSSNERVAHACSYCGYHDPSSVAQCVETKRWFCNSNRNTCASHLVQHLVLSRSKQIMLHPDSPLGEMVLECYHCGMKNVFMLGFIPAKVDSVVVLLCREPCLNIIANGGYGGDDVEWNLESWMPLIEDKTFLSWLLEVPTEQQLLRQKHPQVKFTSTTNIHKLEKVWKKLPDSDATMEDVLTGRLNTVMTLNDEENRDENGDDASGVAPIRLDYTSGKEYVNILSELVDLEAEYDKQMREQHKFHNIEVTWDQGLNKRIIASFNLNYNRESSDFRLSIGDELKLSFDPEENHIVGPQKWEGVGSILNITDTAIILEMLQNDNGRKGIPTDITEFFTVECVWRGVSYKRMNEALLDFENEESSVSGYLYYKLLGKNIPDQEFKDVEMPRTYSVPGLPEINHSQLSAIRSVLPKPLSLIQGPPGTGKTVTSATLVYHLARESKRQKDKMLKERKKNRGNKKESSKWHRRRQKGKKGNSSNSKNYENYANDDNFDENRLLNYNKILVCAPSNVAVDQLTEKIHKTGLKVIRIAAKTRELISTGVDHLTLHQTIHTLITEQTTKEEENFIQTYQTKNRGTRDVNVLAQYEKEESKQNRSGGRKDKYKDLRILYLFKHEIGELSDKDNRIYRRLYNELCVEILETADVICTTCVGAADPRLKLFTFRQVLIDEATQAIEPESLIPIVKGAKQLILVGDHCQLGPVLMSKVTRKKGLNQSLFERLLLLGNRPIRLAVQYRMHPCLSRYPSNTFYEGTLQNGVTEEDRLNPSIKFPWPNPSKPMLFLLSSGSEELAGNGTSYLNRQEAITTEKIITYFLQLGVDSNSLGVITPYEGQRSYIVSHMQRVGTAAKEKYSQIEVASVDAFQGREKDYILFSLVRSNRFDGIGFLNDPRRLNVALTRARYGLILIGNAKMLAEDPLFNSVLHHYKDMDCIVQGNVGNFSVSKISFPSMKDLQKKALEKKRSRDNNRRLQREREREKDGSYTRDPWKFNGANTNSESQSYRNESETTLDSTRRDNRNGNYFRERGENGMFRGRGMEYTNSQPENDFNGLNNDASSAPTRVSNLPPRRGLHEEDSRFDLIYDSIENNGSERRNSNNNNNNNSDDIFSAYGGLSSFSGEYPMRSTTSTIGDFENGVLDNLNPFYSYGEMPTINENGRDYNGYGGYPPYDSYGL